jgi:predicted flap endonuclease-1-like 5' DNA nuclease
MNSLFYLLLIAALFIGFAMGWVFRRTQQLRRSSVPANPPLALAAINQRSDPSLALAISPLTAIQDAEAQRLQMEMALASLNKDIAALRTQVKSQEQEYSHLLIDLDEFQTSPTENQSVSSGGRRNNYPEGRKTEDILASMDERGEEMDALQEMHDSFQVRINRLTQQVQRQDDTLHILYQTLRSKTEELNEAQALLERRDSERERIIRQREQRDRDIARELDLFAQRDKTFQSLLQKTTLTPAEDEPFASDLIPGDEEDPILTLPFPAALPDGISSDNPDDLTDIIGLGKLYADQLRLHGIETFEHLARSRPEDIQRMLQIPGHFSPDIRRWIATANQIVTARRNLQQNGE